VTANTPVPTKRQILDFINESPTPVGKREIARAFGMRGSDRIALKSVLKELQDEGLLDRGRKRQVRPTGALRRRRFTCARAAAVRRRPARATASWPMSSGRARTPIRPKPSASWAPGRRSCWASMNSGTMAA
jgi:hypothetical protein